MKVILLDGNKIDGISELHDAFRQEMDLPVWYGANLDALHDVLTETMDEIGVIAVNTELLAENIGERRWMGFLRLMRDVEEECENFHFCLEPF